VKILKLKMKRLSSDKDKSQKLFFILLCFLAFEERATNSFLKLKSEARHFKLNSDELFL